MSGASQHKSDADLIRDERNVSRFCVENRQISWVLLIATVVWGIYGYIKMPKRKDPIFPVVTAAAVCPWPGVRLKGSSNW